MCMAIKQVAIAVNKKVLPALQSIVNAVGGKIELGGSPDIAPAAASLEKSIDYV